MCDKNNIVVQNSETTKEIIKRLENDIVYLMDSNTGEFIAIEYNLIKIIKNYYENKLLSLEIKGK